MGILFQASFTLVAKDVFTKQIFYLSLHVSNMFVLVWIRDFKCPWIWSYNLQSIFYKTFPINFCINPSHLFLTTSTSTRRLPPCSCTSRHFPRFHHPVFTVPSYRLLAMSSLVASSLHRRPATDDPSRRWRTGCRRWSSLNLEGNGRAMEELPTPLPWWFFRIILFTVQQGNPLGNSQGALIYNLTPS